MLELGFLRTSNLLVRDDAVEAFLSNMIGHVHPWLRDVTGVPAGKLWQIATLFCEGFYDALEQALPGNLSDAASHGGGVMNLLYTEAWLRAWASAASPSIASRRVYL